MNERMASTNKRWNRIEASNLVKFLQVLFHADIQWNEQCHVNK